MNEGVERLRQAETLISDTAFAFGLHGFDHISSRCREMEITLEELYGLIDRELNGVPAIVANLHRVAIEHGVEPSKFTIFWLAAFPTNHRVEDMTDWAKRLVSVSRVSHASDAAKAALKDAGYKIELYI